MVKRSIYYWSRVYAKPLKQGMVYKQLRPVIAINIMNFNLFEQSELFHSTYHLYEYTQKTLLTYIMEFHFIEIPKLLKDWKAQKLNPWNDVLARWLLLLGMVDHRKGTVYEDIYKELEAIAMKDERLLDAFTQWQELSLSDEQYFAYEGRLKRILDEEAAVIEAKLREEEALQKGLEQGLEQGIQKEKIETAQKMIAKGYADAIISELTNLSAEQIQQLRNELSQ